jgi:hypothetical protein
MTIENRLTHEELERQAESIMNNFDFERVHKHMEAVDHKWYRDGEMVQPTKDDLKINARRLLTHAIWSDEHCTNVGTGGFVAYKLPWGLRLTFELTWS